MDVDVVCAYLDRDDKIRFGRLAYEYKVSMSRLSGILIQQFIEKESKAKRRRNRWKYVK